MDNWANEHEYQQKIQKLNYEVETSNRRLVNAQVEISKLKTMKTRIMNMVLNSNKDVFASVSEKMILNENKQLESENQEDANIKNLQSDNDSFDYIEKKSDKLNIEKGQEKLMQDFNDEIEILKDEADVMSNQLNLKHDQNKHYSDKLENDKNNPKSLNKKYLNLFKYDIHKLIGENVNENKRKKNINSVKNKLVENVFQRINSKALDILGVNLINFEKYEERLLNHYAGLSNKIQALESEENFPTENYLLFDWQYVLVFPNPDYDKTDKHCKIEETQTLYDKFFFPDTSKTSFLKGQISEKKVFDFVIRNKISDEETNSCLVNKGGCFQKKINNEWKYVSSESFDLKSLVRNVCLYKLTKVLKLNTLCLLSKTGEYIYALISADEELLKDQAEKSEYQLQLDVAETDPLSLEPCDAKWRPLRLSKAANKSEKILNKEKEIEFLYTHIYKKEPDYLKNLFPSEQAYVYNKTWIAYEHYLDFLIANKAQILTILHSNEELNGIFIKGIFNMAFEYSYKKTGVKLKSLWSYYKIDSIGSYSSYIRKDDFSLIDEAYFFWRRYFLNNREKSTIFKGIDYINLILAVINSQLDLDELLNAKYLINHFPLHNKTYFDDYNALKEVERIQFSTKKNKEHDLNAMKNIEPIKKENISQENIIIPNAFVNEINDEANNNLNNNDKDLNSNINKHKALNGFINLIKLNKGEEIKFSGEDSDENKHAETNNFIKTNLVEQGAFDEKLPEKSIKNKYQSFNVEEARVENLDKMIVNQQNLIENFKELRNAWSFSLFGEFPQQKVRDYFGEKVCIIVYIVQMTDSFESVNIELYYDKGYTKSNSVIIINTLYSFSVIIWSTFFLENWKKNQATYATLWGQLDYESREETMPTYRGKIRRSPLNDNMNEIHYSPVKTFLRKIIAYIISLIIVIIVITVVIYLLYFRNWLVVNKVWGDDNKIIQNMPTVLNAIQIFIFNFIYNIIAIKMNRIENHKHYSSFENSLAAKMFIFQFVNSFNSLIIIAYFKRIVPSLGGCVKTLQSGKVLNQNNFCDEELSNQLITIAIINFLKNFSEIGIPFFKNKFKHFLSQNKNKLDSKDILNILRESVDAQINLENFNRGWSDAIFDDYLEIIIQFGFVTLFAISFPLTPVIAWLTNVLETEVDKYKILRLYKRPIPLGAKDIGNWILMVEILTYLSIFSNLGLLIFSSNTYYSLDLNSKMVLFTGLVVFYSLCKIIIDKILPDIPKKMKDLSIRMTFISDRLKKVYLKKERKYLKNKKVDFNIYTC